MDAGAIITVPVGLFLCMCIFGMYVLSVGLLGGAVLLWVLAVIRLGVYSVKRLTGKPPAELGKAGIFALGALGLGIPGMLGLCAFSVIK